MSPGPTMVGAMTRVLVVDDDETVAADVAHNLRAGAIDMDVLGREVRIAGEPVALTVREFELLLFFMLHPSQVFRRQVLLERVWGYSFGDTSTVTVHVRRLREKVEA